MKEGKGRGGGEGKGKGEGRGRGEGSSLVPRRRGGGERPPGIHCLCMCLIATEFHGDRVRTYTYVYW